MNIWVEYFRKELSTLNNHAQIRENLKWTRPPEDQIIKRFCQTREDAVIFARSMEKQGYHATIKTDGIGAH